MLRGLGLAVLVHPENFKRHATLLICVRLCIFCSHSNSRICRRTCRKTKLPYLRPYTDKIVDTLCPLFNAAVKYDTQIIGFEEFEGCRGFKGTEMDARVRHSRHLLDHGMDPCTCTRIEQHLCGTFLRTSLDSCLDDRYSQDTLGSPAGGRHLINHRIHGARTGLASAVSLSSALGKDRDVRICEISQ